MCNTVLIQKSLDIIGYINYMASSKYSCDACKFATNHKTNYNHHIASDRHLRLISGDESYMTKPYSCSFCKYGTTNANAYSHHCSSVRHRRLMGETEWRCKCGVYCQSSKALAHHIHSCEYEPPEPTESPPNDKLEVLVTELVVAQKESNVLQKEANELTRTHGSAVGNTITNNTDNSIETFNQTNNNQQYNINIFLNENCKDALNIGDAIAKIILSSKDIDDMRVSKNPKALGNLITREFEKLAVTERPIHCTDKKRNKCFVKDADIWQKDPDGRLVDGAIEQIRAKQGGGVRDMFVELARTGDTQSRAAKEATSAARVWSTPRSDRDNQETRNRAMDACYLSKKDIREIVDGSRDGLDGSDGLAGSAGSAGSDGLGGVVGVVGV